MPGSTVLAIAGDPGGAAALAPVLRRLRQDGVQLEAFGYREAPSIWHAAGVTCTSIPDSAGDDWIVTRLAASCLLLVATSVNGIDWERRAVALASAAGVPTIALLDFWSNYRRRFSDAQGHLYLPHRICVMDELARDEMRTDGFPDPCIVVTGHPAFDVLQARRETFGEGRREQLRRDAGIADDEFVVLYVSQPLSDLYGSPDAARAALGYEEAETYVLCATTLAQLAQRHQVKLAMAIRKHPRERGELPPVPQHPPFRTLPSLTEDRLDAVLAADLVLGMSSMLLMEAVVLGRIVVSVQPGLRGSDTLPSNRDGRSLAVRKPPLLMPTLEKAVFDAPWRRQHLINLRSQLVERNATAKVTALVHHLRSTGVPPIP